MTKKHIVSGLNKLLEPLGFAKKGAAWNRVVGPYTDVVDLQVSKSQDRVTLNIGVIEKSVYFDCWDRVVDDFINEPNCIVRTRILTEDNKEKWWQIADADTVEDMVASVKNFVLPFFDKHHSLDSMREFLIQTNVVDKTYPPPVIYLAIILHRLGKSDEACLRLGALKKKTVGAWLSRVEEIAEKLKCIVSPRES